MKYHIVIQMSGFMSKIHREEVEDPVTAKDIELWERYYTDMYPTSVATVVNVFTSEHYNIVSDPSNSHLPTVDNCPPTATFKKDPALGWKKETRGWHYLTEAEQDQYKQGEERMHGYNWLCYYKFVSEDTVEIYSERNFLSGPSYIPYQSLILVD